MNLHPASKILIFAGFALIVAGLLWQFLAGALKIGQLPGDFRVEKENFGFYFPLTSSILVSLILSGIFWLYQYFSK